MFTAPKAPRSWGFHAKTIIFVIVNMLTKTDSTRQEIISAVMTLGNLLFKNTVSNNPHTDSKNRSSPKMKPSMWMFCKKASSHSKNPTLIINKSM